MRAVCASGVAFLVTATAAIFSRVDRHRSLAVLAALLAPLSARAEPANPLADRLSVSLGGFLLTTDTNVRVDGDSGNGTDFDVERELGFHDSDRFRIDAYWRFRPSHKLRVMYFDTRRTAAQQIENEITFRDTTFAADTEIEATFKTAVAELAYEWAFLRTDRYEVAGSIGIHNLRFDLDLRATGGQQISSSASANGPLPVLGLHGVWRWTDRVYLDAQAQYFQISLDPYDGRIEDYNVSIVWQAFDRVGLGAGYNAFVTRLDVDDDNFDGHLRWRYDGARVFLVASF